MLSSRISCVHYKSTFSTILRPRLRWRPSDYRMVSTIPTLPVFKAIANHKPTSTAVVHSPSGRRFTYGELLRDVADRKEKLQNITGKSIEGERIAFLIENGYDYIGANYKRPKACETYS